MQKLFAVCKLSQVCAFALTVCKILTRCVQKIKQLCANVSIFITFAIRE